MIFAAKLPIVDPGARTFEIIAAKTMYGGKKISAGDAIYIFASENEGGAGLIARGIILEASQVAKIAGVARQTPRVSVTVERTALARRRLGRAELKRWTDPADGSPQSELNFKFYRQATNKIVGISDRTAEFLSTCF